MRFNSTSQAAQQPWSPVAGTWWLQLHLPNPANEQIVVLRQRLEKL